MSSTAENAALILGIAVPLSAAVLWVIHAIVAPLRVVVENNNTIIERVMDRLDKHADKLDDHGVRIACIETRHDVEMGN